MSILKPHSMPVCPFSGAGDLDCVLQIPLTEPVMVGMVMRRLRGLWALFLNT